ncbi:MAG: NrdH-redoxin [Oscillospiraceae bacterium]|nr:NrdH-redoxin [Oscillospiraceae bacterium]
MIKVFSSDNCGWCTKLKSYLDSRRIRYDVIDVNESRENYDRLVQVSGQSGIPVAVFDSGEVVVGFDKAKIDSIIGSA